MILFPQAKINLGLRVTAKRQDGFHNIESLLYQVPLCDVLEFRPAAQFKLTVYGRKIPGPAGQNILARTWALMHRCFSIPPVEVILLKNIPPGSGLGGGSSDAACFLKGLDRIFHLNLSGNRLHKLALQLGSDVPFFLENKPAWVTGRGDVVSAVPFHLKDLWLVMVVPQVSFSTADMFSLVKPAKPDISPKELIHLPVNCWHRVVQNDFEEAAFRREPVLARVKSRLLSLGARVASLTGTGSALYALYDDEPETTGLWQWGEVFKYKMK